MNIQLIRLKKEITERGHEIQTYKTLKVFMFKYGNPQHLSSGCLGGVMDMLTILCRQYEETKSNSPPSTY